MELKKSTSLLGDALQILKSIPSQSMDVCIADPPYNMSKKKGLKWAFSKHVTMQERWDQFSDEDYLNFSSEWLYETCRVVKPNGNLLVFGTFHNIYKLGVILQQLDRKILNSIIWFKPNAQPNITCRMLTESTEQIIWVANESAKKASKWTFNYAFGKTLNNGKQLRNVWSVPVTPKKERMAKHPTQKPYALIERLVLLYSNPGDWILDPFSGLGTTASAALKHGRHCLIIENQKNYFEAQKERFKKEGLHKNIQFQTFRSKRLTQTASKKTGTLKMPPNQLNLIP